MKKDKEIIKLKQENALLRDTKLVKELTRNLKEIRNGNFITRERLGF